jgi:hypothetical protein
MFETHAATPGRDHRPALRTARLAIAALLLAPAGASAETVRLGSLQFEAPSSGWTSKPTKNGVIFQKEFPKDADNRRKGAALIQILGPFAAKGSFDDDFETMVGLVKGFAEERPMRKAVGTTTNGHRIRSDYRCCVQMKNLSTGQRTVGLSSERNRAFFGLVELGLRGDALKSAERDFAAMVRSVRLEAGDEAFDLVPKPGDGGLDGVYTHLDTGVTPNAFGGVDFHSDSEITFFDPSGLYAKALPTDGNVVAHCRAEPTDCGLYALKGGGLLSGAREIEMREVADDLGTIETEVKPFAKSGESLTIDEATYSAVKPLEAGTPLDGTWRYFFASSGTTATSSGGVSSETILTLRRDGAFRREGSSGAMSTNEIGGGTTGVTAGGDRPADSGTYAVDGYTLVLTGRNGRAERLSIFAPEAGSDTLLVIDGSNYLRQE